MRRDRLRVLILGNCRIDATQKKKLPNPDSFAYILEPTMQRSSRLNEKNNKKPHQAEEKLQDVVK